MNKIREDVSLCVRKRLGNDPLYALYTVTHGTEWGITRSYEEMRALLDKLNADLEKLRVTVPPKEFEGYSGFVAG